MDDPVERFDVIIVGAGPAGLSAALMLGRCRRTVLLLDSGEPRNAASRALHGYLTQDGVTPWALRDQGRGDLKKYGTVKVREAKVTGARQLSPGFAVTFGQGETARSRLMLLATGRVDPLPDIPGFGSFFGRGVYHCPYCDGWEHRDQPLGVLGGDQDALETADLLRTWSPDVTVYTNAAPGLAAAEPSPPRPRVLTKSIHRLAGDSGRLERIIFSDGSAAKCDALFFPTPCEQRSSLPEQLGCLFCDDGSIRCTGHGATGVPGLFVAGNVRGGVHLAITAAAEGAEAAIALNRALLPGTHPEAHPADRDLECR
jgi:thioredoxin reductase